MSVRGVDADVNAATLTWRDSNQALPQAKSRGGAANLTQACTSVHWSAQALPRSGGAT